MNRPAVDTQILALLESDGRLTNTEIARRLNVSEALVRQRVRKALSTSAVKRGVIVDFSVLNVEIVACLRIAFVSSLLDAAIDRLALEPSTGLVLSTTGRFNAFVIVAVEDQAALASFVDAQVRGLDGFLGVEVSIISTALKYDSRLAPLSVSSFVK